MTGSLRRWTDAWPKKLAPVRSWNTKRLRRVRGRVLLGRMTLYAIGDIHGHIDLLRAAHDLVEADRAREGTGGADLVHLGDLVDRGPDSAGVVAFLMQSQTDDPRIKVLKGNHDRLLHWFLEQTPRIDTQLRSDLNYLSGSMGGMTTLASYGVDISLSAAEIHRQARSLVPKAHIAFLIGLPVMHQSTGCVCVHAGIRPGVPFNAQTEDDLLWIRRAFLDDPRDHGALVVHGHTPRDSPEHFGNRLNLDSGAAFGGPLSVVAIEDHVAFLLTDRGRVKIPVQRR